jgi:superoxide dismutase, Fe-Mn family
VVGKINNMFTLTNLPFAYNALEPFMDEETMHFHHDGHHAAYVKNLNDALVGHDEFLNMDVEKLLQSLDKVPEDIRTKVKNNAGGHFHHTFFWTLLRLNNGNAPEGKVADLINKTFGDFNSFKEKFSQSAMGLFGSGWTWLLAEEGKLLIENTFNQNSPVSLGRVPILTLDLWEHGYYLKYKNKRADYINAFWNIINWEEVENKLNKC